MQGELKECPFCGGIDIVLHPNIINLPCDSYMLCRQCEATGPSYRSEHKAKNAWNTRAKRTSEMPKRTVDPEMLVDLDDENTNSREVKESK